MPINTGELMNAIAVVADERSMKATLKQSGRAAIFTGVATFVGGVLGGPVGLAVGAAVGGVSSAIKYSGSFKPLSEIVRYELTDRQKDQLRMHVVNAFRQVHPTDLAFLIPKLMGDAGIQAMLMKEVANFLTREVGLMISN